MSISTIEFIGLLVLLATAWLLREFARNLTKGAVDEHVGRLLGDHRHALELKLENHRAGQTRDLQALRQSLDQQLDQFSRDYGLFAERRNTVYAELYALLEKARGHHADAIALTRIGPDFNTAAIEDLAAYAEREEHFIPSEKASIARACAEGKVDVARTLISDLENHALRRRADASFRAWKNSWILNTLYLSDTADAALNECNLVMAAISAELSTPHHEGISRWERRKELAHNFDLAAVQVRKTMKSEMTGAFAERAPVPIAASDV